MANILVTRFSALGDVAMTVSVLKSFADSYPDDHITLLSRPFIAPLLEGLPDPAPSSAARSTVLPVAFPTTN